MKKIVAILVVTLAAWQADAQVTVKPGVRAGVNFSTFTHEAFDTRTDFYVGGLVGIKLAKFYTLQPELNYSRQGAKGRIYYTEFNNFDPVIPSPLEYSREHDYSIQYLSFGIMNKFTFLESFHAIVGPTLDFRVGDNFPDVAQLRAADFDLGLSGGIGYTLPIGLTVEARYKLGLVDVFGDIYNDDWDDDDWYNDDRDIILNSVIQLGLSYSF